MFNATDGRLHRFYSTDLAPCPYLPERQERRLVALVEGQESNERLDLLTEAGFRRSQSYLYKPVCPDCRRCVPVRIDVAGFQPGRSFRKVLARNSDLTASPVAAVATDEQFSLFNRYLRRRHQDGGMVRMDRAAYAEMVELAPGTTRLIEFRDRSGRLAGVSLTDFVRSGLSGVYKFFDPDLAQRSLGTFIILWHVEHARRIGLSYVYLGYWIGESRKMTYKARFAPLECLDGAFWRPFAPETPESA
jgi:arginyl-tRNA--protein-N-Asp/Glu arginylyltransferase